VYWRRIASRADAAETIVVTRWLRQLPLGLAGLPCAKRGGFFLVRVLIASRFVSPFVIAYAPFSVAQRSSAVAEPIPGSRFA